MNKARVAYVSAVGREAGEDPYFPHLYRVSYDGATTRLDPRSEAQAQALADELRAATFTVGAVTHKTQRRQAPAPYTTSTLQQDASSRLRFSPKKTMSVAQELYRGRESDTVRAQGHHIRRG